MLQLHIKLKEIKAIAQHFLVLKNYSLKIAKANQLLTKKKLKQNFKLNLHAFY